jgi:HEPN domain-containing protein
MGKNEAEFARWFEQARDDLAAARASKNAGHHEWACFQAQQAAEKALKAFLLLQGKRQFVSHSIKELLREAQDVAPQLQTLSKARRLDEYYIPTRYPNGLPGGTRPHEFYDEEEANECLQLAQWVLDAIDRIQRS